MKFMLILSPCRVIALCSFRIIRIIADSERESLTVTSNESIRVISIFISIPSVNFLLN